MIRMASRLYGEVERARMFCESQRRDFAPELMTPAVANAMAAFLRHAAYEDPKTQTWKDASRLAQALREAVRAND